MTTDTHPKPDPERYMRAYWHEFTPTGVDAIDAILEAIAMAGKAYHSTEQWCDAEDYGVDGYWSLIQRRADEAAATSRRSSSIPAGDVGKVLEALTALLKKAEHIYGVLYYAEPWGHQSDAAFNAARAALASLRGAALPAPLTDEPHEDARRLDCAAMQDTP